MNSLLHPFLIVVSLVLLAGRANYLAAQDSTIQALTSVPDSSLLTPDSSKVYFFYTDFETQGPGFLQQIDTSITNIQKYDPVDKPGLFYATLGNQGLAHKSLVYEPRIHSGYEFGMNAFREYMFYNDSIRYYWVGRPYTHVKYIMGSKKEQNLHIDHSQNVATWFNVGLRFRYINSPGFYRNQEGDDKNFVFKTRFQTKDYRYMVLANYIHNKLKIEENGGIVYDTVFEDNIITDRRGIAVNLSTASNYIKENSYYVKQFFKLSKRNRFNSQDTTRYSSFLDRLNPGNISHSIQLMDQTYIYQQTTQDNNGFYPNTYDSTKPTYDSTRIYRIENQVAWTNADNAKKQFLTFNFKLRYLYIEQSVDSVKSIYNQLIPTGEVNFKISDLARIHFFGDFVTGNSNAGDFNLLGKLKLTTKFGNVFYSFHTANQEIPKLYSFYKSNHFRWNNNFKKQYFIINSAGYSYKTLQAGVNFIAIDNFTYFNTDALPAQMNENLQLLQIYVHKLFRLGNWSLDGRMVYQKASDYSGIRLPDWLAEAGLYYTKDLFKQAAILQTGANVMYNTLYDPYAYMPATRVFHVQNQKELGNYFYTNLFLNLQIKRARLFLKYYNLGSAFGDYNYFTVPSYPMKDGGFRFGVSWMFYD